MKRLTRAFATILILALVAVPSVAAADAHDEVDGRAHVSFVDGVLDEEGQLWFKVGFYSLWDETPPSDVFSLFWSLTVTVDDEVRTIGWQTHDGEDTFLGDEGTQAFILDNGCVLVATGIYPEEPYDVQIEANFASWDDETTTSAVSGTERMGTSSEFVDVGDPFALVGTPVYDLTTGSAVTGEPPDSDPSTTTTTTASTSSTVGEPGSADDPVDGSGSNFLLIFLIVIALAFLLWWFGIRPRRYAYRADREVGLDIVDEEDTSADSMELEAESTEGGFPLVVEEPDTSFEDPCWEQSQKVNEAQDRLRDLETEQAETDPSYEETHKALDQAIDQARENLTAAQKALDECMEAQSEPAEDEGPDSGASVVPPPTPPAEAEEPQEFSKDCKEEEAAYEAAVAATDAAKERRDAAEAAWLEANTALSTAQSSPTETDLDSARAAEEAARAERDASVEEQDAAIDAENEARRALDTCRRVSVDAEPADDGPVGVATGTPEESADCVDGSEEWRYESQSRRFVVLNGDVRIRISNAPATWGAWQRANGTATTVSAEALRSLDASHLEDLLTPLPDNRRVIPSITIPTKRIRVRCERLYRCQNGNWVATEHVRKNPVEFNGPDESFGGRDVSTVGNIIALLDLVKDRLDELAAELEAGRDFECEK